MDLSWNFYIDENEDPQLPLETDLLPSSIRDMITDNNRFHLSLMNKNVSNIIHRQLSDGDNVSQIFMQKENIFIIDIKQYVLIKCHQNKIKVFVNGSKLQLNIGDIVLTEADRGYDIGQIISIDIIPSKRDINNAKTILRKATQAEILKIKSQREKEIQAKEICQMKADELNLQMKITSTELQFDEKKLTVYFSAEKYVDFRNLVHSLFRYFGIRIWMVWLDGQEPVKDVFTHGTKKVFQNNERKSNEELTSL